MKNNNIKNIAEGYANLLKKGLSISESKVEELALKRQKVCDTCKHKTEQNTCAKCGCFLPAKTRCVKCKCPQDFW